MPEISPTAESKPRIPLPTAGIQVNHCRNLACVNFGVPAATAKLRAGRRPVGQKPGDRYIKSGSGAMEATSLTCDACGSYTTVQSNGGIAEELERSSRYLEPRPAPCCPTEGCENSGRSVDDAPESYYRFGSTMQGSRRFRCRACNRTFSIAKPTFRQRLPHKNIMFFKLLHTRISLSKIKSVLDLSWPTVYGKIDFLHEQCLRFLGDREREISSRRFGELFLANDRQVYLTNWSRSDDARNTALTATGTADLWSGYVFAMNLDYDPDVDPAVVEAEAIAAGDYDVQRAWRRHARLWLEGDYAEHARSVEESQKRKAERMRKTKARKMGLEDLPGDEMADLAEGPDGWDRKLPDKGMLVHSEYTMYAHFQLLRRLLAGAERLNFYADQDLIMPGALFSAFVDRIERGELDLFQVDVTKGLTLKRKREMVGATQRRYRKWLKERRTDGSIGMREGDYECRLTRIVEAIRARRDSKSWIEHPFPNIAEPEKRVLHVTDLGESPAGWVDEYPTDDGDVIRIASRFAKRPADPEQQELFDRLQDRHDKYRKDVWQLARLHHEASLHAIDRYFMQVRREISALERGIVVSKGKGSRVWYGYSPYDPAIIPKLIDIHRVYYNYIQVGEDGRTRAERLGIARGKIRHQDVIYYR